MTLQESSFSSMDSPALTMPSRQRAMMGATEDSTLAAPTINSRMPRVRFSSSSCRRLKTYKIFRNQLNSWYIKISEAGQEIVTRSNTLKCLLSCQYSQKQNEMLQREQGVNIKMLYLLVVLSKARREIATRTKQ